MSAWGIVLYAAVGLWVIPGALSRPVAIPIFLEWAVSEFLYKWVTGDRFPLEVYYPMDCAVIATIYLWRSHWSDWIVPAGYLIAWPLYGVDETRAGWITLYFVFLAQCLIVGPWPYFAWERLVLTVRSIGNMPALIKGRFDRWTPQEP